MQTEEQVKCIKPINTDTVHKICSGQVVLSLATAVKELIENALDAQSSVIDVRLKNHGIDLIEVSDNGTGVTEDNFAGLTLKYHTSKLNEYSDLLGVKSFGFRGEALSSLCALATLTITTRHSTATYATKLEYDFKGNIIKKTPCSRQIGTTVSLTNLFSTLPVRQKEFHRNAKREFNKMTQLLYAYCLISLNIKITCTNSTTANSKSVVVATQGSSSYIDNIACVFGSKQLQTILQIKPEYVSNIKDNIFKGLSLNSSEIVNNTDIIEDVEIDLSEDSNDADSASKQSQNNSSQGSSGKSQGHINSICPVEFTGFISSCAHGSGRSSCDRQFYYINSRPCEPMKIMKLINEVYKQLNPHQYPFVFLNVAMDGSLVDVNVTPDKRKVFLAKEKLIMDVLKMSLGKLFEHIPGTLKVDTVTDALKTSYSNDDEKYKEKNSETILQKFAITCKSKSKPEVSTNTGVLKRKSTSMLDFVSSKTSKIDFTQEVEHVSSTIIYIENLPNENDKSLIKDNQNLSNDNYIKDNTNQDSLQNVPYIYEPELENGSNKSLNESNSMSSDKETLYLECADMLPNTQIRNVNDIIEKSSTIYCKTKSSKNKSPVNKEKVPKNVQTDKEDLGKQHRKSVTLKTSLDHIKSLFDIYNKKSKETQPNRVKFRSQINPVFNKKCEEELSREISKSSFKEMIVVGQFNLGFIITQLKSDLFIIDQHATDEIYNFETLQKSTELTSQKLVCPQKLELTGVNEQILMDNLEIFKKNGFTFQIDALAPPTKRVKLLTIPMSKNWVFGKEDIEELLFMIRESPNENCRPSRVRAMFASRACRKSVMIGTALSKSDMKLLINHMGEIDKPWNCPHGRPTIRHLVNLDMVHIKED